MEVAVGCHVALGRNLCVCLSHSPTEALAGVWNHPLPAPLASGTGVDRIVLKLGQWIFQVCKWGMGTACFLAPPPHR